MAKGMAANPKDAATSNQRARELYKYFAPPGSTFATTQSPFPDTVLTAHAQLVAWRLNCQRAMVSLIDRDIQYFVAESSKTLRLDDSTQYEDPSDAIWAGCISVPKAGRLCEHTIQTIPSPDSPACFEVCDLTKDDRFNTLPFVTGAPYFKYYCGVPLFTKNGIPIGSLFALDHNVREPINKTNKIFLTTMADNIMSHYENMKEKEDRKRVLNMNMCLAAFVDPEHQVRKRKRKSGSSYSRHSPAKSAGREKDTEAPALSKAQKRALSEQTGLQSSSNRASDSEDSANTSTRSRVGEDDHIETFRRAADLLHASLSIEGGGGVVFLDTSTSYWNRHPLRKLSDDSSEENSEVEARSSRQASVSAPTDRSTTGTSSRPRDSPEVSRSSSATKATVLASTITADEDDYVPLSHDDIARLIKRHPRGKLFNLDSDFLSSSSSDEQATYKVPKNSKITPTRREASVLSKHFPEAKQVIFLPLLDATASKFSALFAYTTNEFRTLSNNPDFLFCVAFSSCVMTEISRLGTLAADQQKSDFIGSVSHELRSPLHGILASCEFLGDTETTSFQKSLVDTADSCARTLLDTINMVLDYSKINAFERNASKARKQRGKIQPGLQESGQSQLNIYGDVDLAGITEEVVEGVATGQIFKDSLDGFDAIDLSAADSDPSGRYTGGRKDVEIIIDIVPRGNPRDWVFVTQPGAFRRIIMNIFGNALKYTRTGSIKVKLEAQTLPQRQEQEEGEQIPATFVNLTITDTGQGMSPHFMRTKLYTPFAQENSIAPGTGLGLSLVKSMVSMLNGEINISSILGVGTEVSVVFPMTLSSSTGSSTVTSGSTPNSAGSAGSIERVKDNSLTIVQQRVRGRQAAIFPGDDRGSSKSANMIRDAVGRYLDGWYGFEVVTWWDKAKLPDIIICDVSDLSKLIKVLPNDLDTPGGPMVVVMCTAASRRSAAGIPKSPNLEAVTYPFGPYKLAKCIRLCLEKIDHVAVPENPEAEMEATDAAHEDVSTPSSGMEEVVMSIEKVTISDPDPNVPDVNVYKSGPVLAAEDSVHAGLLTVSSSHGTTSSGSSQEHQEYPFPLENDGTISPSNLDHPELGRPLLMNRRTISATMNEMSTLHHQAVSAAPVSSKGATTASPPQQETEQPKTHPPRLLLVDDNKVNLRLLQTFMKKRKYDDVFCAEDGHQAVKKFQELLCSTPPHPPDIIFMDISMPVMNGFEATRKIRDIELEIRDQFSGHPMGVPATSLIIALTGLASGRDQSEAFTSGFDLYLVKPVSFREVGRLLDNWEKSGGAAMVGVPHGALTGEGSAQDTPVKEASDVAS